MFYRIFVDYRLDEELVNWAYKILEAGLNERGCTVYFNAIDDVTFDYGDQEKKDGRDLGESA